jgi:hypothetical protein
MTRPGQTELAVKSPNGTLQRYILKDWEYDQTHLKVGVGQMTERCQKSIAAYKKASLGLPLHNENKDMERKSPPG